MINKWINAWLLCGGLLASTVNAQAIENCNLPQHDASYANNCVLSLEDVDTMSAYFKDSPEISFLNLIEVQMDKQVSKKLATFVSESENVAGLYFSHTQFDSVDLPTLIDNNHIRFLALEKNNFAEADLLSLAENKQYALLLVDEDNLSNQGLSTILDGSKVDVLYLMNRELTDEDMNSIVAKHTYLKGLGIVDCKVNNLNALKGMSNLQSLALDGLHFSEQDIRTISQLTNLYALTLSETNLTASHMQQLTQLSNMRSFIIENLDLEKHPGIGDEGVKYINQFSQLRGLFLRNQHITDKGALSLSQNMKVEYMSLPNNDIGDEGAMSIAHMPALKYLVIDNNKIGDKGGIELAHQSTLKDLYLSMNQLTDKTAMAFAERTAEMFNLFLEGHHFSKAARDALLNNPNIYYVRLGSDSDALAHKYFPNPVLSRILSARNQAIHMK